MKKQIIIISHAMEIGGAERAMLALMNSIDYERYDVDIFLLRHTGELMPMIPEQVNLLPEIKEYSCLAVPFAGVLKRGAFTTAFGRLTGKAMAWRYDRANHIENSAVGLEYSHKYTLKFMPEISSKIYDLAISFLTPHYICAHKVKAKKKIAWIHTDYSTIAVDKKSELKMWSHYDNIISISDKCSEAFCETFPELRDKLVRIDNIMLPELIKRQAYEFSTENEMPEDGSIKLLSIGRFCAAKNFDNIPEICSRILQTGLNVKWYIIGYGGDEHLIRQRITEYGMEHTVIILGKRDNPYPYINACDMYIQPSRYEGNCVCVHEAQILAKPVVITKYPTSASQLEDGVDGIIVPMDNDECAAGIAALLRNREKMMQLSENCKVRDYSNAREVEKLYELVGD